MSSIKKLCEKLVNANRIGVDNLALKGVYVSDKATTLEIMKGIAGISDDYGKGYDEIVFNENETQARLIDVNGKEHTISFEKDTRKDSPTFGKMTSLMFDGITADVEYDTSESGVMKTIVGDTEVVFPDMYPSSQYTDVRFLVGDNTLEPYERLFVANGNQYKEPRTRPISDEGYFSFWKDTDNPLAEPAYFPAVAQGGIKIYTAVFSLLTDRLYEHYGIDRDAYPYVFVYFKEGASKSICLAFCSEYQQNTASNSILSFNRPCYCVSYGAFSKFPETTEWQHSWDDVEKTVEYVMDKLPVSELYYYKLSDTAFNPVEMGVPTYIYTNAAIDRDIIEVENNTVIKYFE